MTQSNEHHGGQEEALLKNRTQGTVKALRKDNVVKPLPRADTEVQGNRNQQEMRRRQAKRNPI